MSRYGSRRLGLPAGCYSVKLLNVKKVIHVDQGRFEANVELQLGYMLKLLNYLRNS